MPPGKSLYLFLFIYFTIFFTPLAVTIGYLVSSSYHVFGLEMEPLLLGGNHHGGSLGSGPLPVYGKTCDTLLSHSRSIAELRLSHGLGFTEAMLEGV